MEKRYDPRYWACIWNKKGHKHRPLVSNYPVFDIHQLIKEKLKELPNVYEYVRKDKKILKIAVSKGRVMVSPEGDYKPHILDVSTIRCGLGGERYTIQCLCGRKYRYLYIIKGFLFCRRCLNLVYPCQLQTPDIQCMAMESKIEKKLSKKEKWDGYTKPYGMHSKTYNRLLKKYREYEERHERYVMKSFGANQNDDISSIFFKH